MTERPRRRGALWALALMLFAGFLFLGAGYRNALRDPIVRRAEVAVADWPRGQLPLRVLLLSDVHVAGPDMPPSRVRRIVARLNALDPDLILLAGDLVSKKSVATHDYAPEDIAAALAGLRAPLGVLAVPGNHDYDGGLAPLARAMRRYGLPFHRNDAVRRGPFVIGMVDDIGTSHADTTKALAAMNQLGRGVRIVISHSPDVVPLIGQPVAAIFAGHTHCGQIRLPWVGAITYASYYGDRFGCGDIRDGRQRVFVGAGLGTSIVPLRFGAPPDVWLVTLGPRAER